MLHQLVQHLQQMKALSRGHLCCQRQSGAARWRPVRLGWAGTARAGHGCSTIRQYHSPCGCRAAANVAACPTDSAPALAAGRGWEQALGVGDTAGKGTGQGETQQILGAQADSCVQRPGLSCRMKPALHAFQGRMPCIYCELTCNLTYFNSRTEEVERPSLGKDTALSPRWLAEEAWNKSLHRLEGLPGGR